MNLLRRLKANVHNGRRAAASFMAALMLSSSVLSDASALVSYAALNDGNEVGLEVTNPDGTVPNGNKPQDDYDTARIYINDIPIRLQIAKIKTKAGGHEGDVITTEGTSLENTVTYKLSGRVEGKASDLLSEYGNDGVELAYDASGNYLGYGWIRGTFEYLTYRSTNPEIFGDQKVELVYTNNVFAGYAYVTRILATANDTNRYVAGATMTLYEGIEIFENPDAEGDNRFLGVTVERDEADEVQNVFVRKGYAGSRIEYVIEKEDEDRIEVDTNPSPDNSFTGLEVDNNYHYTDEINDEDDTDTYTWVAKTIQRDDTPILFYSLSGLTVTSNDTYSSNDAENEKEIDDIFGDERYNRSSALYGFDRAGNVINITPQDGTDRTIFAFKKSDESRDEPFLEFEGGDFTQIRYSDISNTIETDGITRIYHLDSDGNRDALIDPQTGIAYLNEEITGFEGSSTDIHESNTGNKKIYVWPVNVYPQDATVSVTDPSWLTATKTYEKIKTNRVATINADTENAYTTGTYNGSGFVKELSPVLDEFGQVIYYQVSDETYVKGEDVYDRDGDYIGFNYTDHLDNQNLDSYEINDHDSLYDGNDDNPFDQNTKYRIDETGTAVDYVSVKLTIDLDNDYVVDGANKVPTFENGNGYFAGFLSTPKEYTDGEMVYADWISGKSDAEKALAEDQDTWYSTKTEAESGNTITITLVFYGNSGTYTSGSGDPHSTDNILYMRIGDTYILENTWVTGETTPNDPFDEQVVRSIDQAAAAGYDTANDPYSSTEYGGMADMLVRVPAGVYIMEELEAPAGYVKGMPVGVTVNESDNVQTAEMVDTTIKVQLEKVDDTSSDYTYDVYVNGKLQKEASGENSKYTEQTGSFTYTNVEGAVIGIHVAETLADGKKNPDYEEQQKTFEEWIATTSHPSLTASSDGTYVTFKSDKDIFIETLPAGEYYLREEGTASGYVTAEDYFFTVTEDTEVTTYFMSDDHIRVEIDKYYTDSNGNRQLITNQYKAKLGLYKNKEDETPVAVWYTDDLSEYTGKTINTTSLIGRFLSLIGGVQTFASGTSFEETYRQSLENDTNREGALSLDNLSFNTVSWSVSRTAELKESETTGSTTKETWLTSNGELITVEGAFVNTGTFSDNATKAFKEAYGKRTSASESTLSYTEYFTASLDKEKSTSLRDQYWNVSYCSEEGDSYGSAFSVIHVTAYLSNNKNADGHQQWVTEFKYNYEEYDEQEGYENMVSYDVPAYTSDAGYGSHRFDYIPAGTYYIKEIETPYGFMEIEPVEITVEETTALQIFEIDNEMRSVYIGKDAYAAVSEEKKSEENFVSSVGGAVLALFKVDSSVEDDKEALKTLFEDFKKVKVNSDNTALSGTPENAVLVDWWVSGSDGTFTSSVEAARYGYSEGDYKPHHVSPIDNGIYYLVEVSAPAFMTVMEPYRIEITGSASSEQLLKAFRGTDYLKYGEVVVKKTDEEGKDLSGASFEIKNLDTGALYQGTTGEDGTLTFVIEDICYYDEESKSFKSCDFVLYEISAPEEYNIDKNSYYFTFDGTEEGSIAYPVSQSSSYDSDTHTFTVVDKPSTLYLEKVDFDTLSNVGGAILEIYKAEYDEDTEAWISEDEPVCTILTNSGDTAYEIAGVTSGSWYVIKETVPRGYSSSGDIYFKVEGGTDGLYVSEISYGAPDNAYVSFTNDEYNGISEVEIATRYAAASFVKLTNVETGEHTSVGVTETEEGSFVSIAAASYEKGTYELENAVKLSDGTYVTLSKSTFVISESDVENKRVLTFAVSKAEAVQIEIENEEGEKVLLMENEGEIENPVKVTEEENYPLISLTNEAAVSHNAIDVSGTYAGHAPVSTDAVITYSVTVDNPGTITFTADENTVPAGYDNIEGITLTYIEDDTGKYSYEEWASSHTSGGKVDISSGKVLTFEISEGGTYGISVLTASTIDAYYIESAVEIEGVSYSYISPVKKTQNTGASLYIINSVTGDAEESREKEFEYAITLSKEGNYSYERSNGETGTLSFNEENGHTASIDLKGSEILWIKDLQTPVGYSIEVKTVNDGYTISHNGEKTSETTFTGTLTNGSIGYENFEMYLADTGTRSSFTKGETYTVRESLLLNDGASFDTRLYAFVLDETAKVSALLIPNRLSVTYIIKTDEKGEPLKGALLNIYDKGYTEEDSPLDSFQTNGEPHLVRLNYSYIQNIDGTVTEISTTSEEASDVYAPESYAGSESVEVSVTALTPGETYTLVETEAPDGYILASPVDFTVEGDGTTNYIYMQDIPTEITIKKTDKQGVPLTGAVLGVYSVESDGTKGNLVLALRDNENPEIKEGNALSFTTNGEDAVLVGQLVVGRTYVLSEISAPEGYASGEDIYFTVSEDGTTVIIGKDEKEALTMVNTLITPGFSKVDITGTEAVAGAVLTITDTYGTTLKDASGQDMTWTSGAGEDSIPVTIFKGGFSAGGTYRLTETSAPDGYAYTETIEFTIDSDGTIKEAYYIDEKGQKLLYDSDGYPTDIVVDGENVSVDEDGNVYINGTLSEDYGFYIEIEDNTIKMKDAPIKATFKKTDFAGEEVDGAECELWEENDEGEDTEIGSWTSGENGEDEKVFEGELKAGGKYRYHEEVSPDGYGYSYDIEFEIDKKGNIVNAHYINKEGKPVIYDKYGFPTDIVYNPDDDTYTYGDTELHKDEYGNLVDDEGNIYAEEGFGFEIPVEDNVVVMKDEPTKVKLVKLDSVGKPVAGAKFQILKEDEYGELQAVKAVIAATPSNATYGDTTIKTDGILSTAHEGYIQAGEDLIFVTPDNGEIDITGQLTAGETYVMKELEAPEGYVITEAEATFTVPYYNTMYPVEVRMYNTPFSVSVSKVDENGTALAGAVLEILSYDEDTETWTVVKAAKDTTIPAVEEQKDEETPEGEEEGQAYILSGDDLKFASSETPVSLEGLLSADTVYRLHEVSAPYGYGLSTDIIFIITTKTTDTGTEAVLKVYDPEAEGSSSEDPDTWTEQDSLVVVMKDTLPKSVDADNDNTTGDDDDRQVVGVGTENTYKVEFVNNETKAATVVITDVLDKGLTYETGSAEAYDSKGTALTTTTSEGEGSEGTSYKVEFEADTTGTTGGKLTWTIYKFPADSKGYVEFKAKVNENAVVKNKVENTAEIKIGENVSYTNTVWNPVPEKDVEISETSLSDGYYTGEFDDNKKAVSVGDILTYRGYVQNTRTDVPKADVTIIDVLDDGLIFSGDTSSAVCVVAKKTEDVYTIEDIEADVTFYTSYTSDTDYKEYTDGDTSEIRAIKWLIKDVPQDDWVVFFFKAEVTEAALVKNEVDNTFDVIIGDHRATSNEVHNPLIKKSVEIFDDAAEDEDTDETSYTLDYDDDREEVDVGDTLEYKVDFKNKYDTAVTITVTDVLDKGLTYEKDSAKAYYINEEGETVEITSESGLTTNYDESTRTLTWTIESFPASASGYVTFRAEVNKNALETYEVENTAKVQIGNDDAIDTNPVKNPVPHKYIERHDSSEDFDDNDEQVRLGDTLTYKIGFKNSYDESKTITVTDVLDKGLTYTKDSAKAYYITDSSDTEISSEESDDKPYFEAEYDESTRTLTWTIYNFPASASGYVRFDGVVNEDVASNGHPGKVVNKASVQIGNDAAVETNEVENPVIVKSVEIYTGTATKDDIDSLLKGDYSDNHKQASVGAYVSYKVAFQNTYDTEATITVTDTLDDGLNYADGTAKAYYITDSSDVEISSEKTDDKPYLTAVYDAKTHKITWTIENFPALTSGYVAFVAQINENALENFEVANKAHVVVETENGQRSETDTNEVENPVPHKYIERYDTGLDFDDDKELVEVGRTLTYKVQFKNTCDEPKTITVTDTLDKGLDFVLASDGGIYDAETRTITWILRDFPANTSGYVTFDVKVNAYAVEDTYADGTENTHPYEVFNKASVRFGNEEAIDTNEVENPIPSKFVEIYDAETDYDDNKEGTSVGSEVSYEITFENDFDTTATVIITDTLDPALTYVSGSATISKEIEGYAKEGNSKWSAYFEKDSTGETGGTITWILRDFPAETKGAVYFEAVINETAIENGSYEVKNKAQVSLTPDKEKEEEPTEPVKDVDVDTTDSRYYGDDGVRVEVGQTLTYKIDFYNNHSEAADVTVTDVLDEHVSYVEGSAVSYVGTLKSEDGTFVSDSTGKTGGTITWNISNVPAKTAGYVEFKVTVLESVFESDDDTVYNTGEVQIGNDTSQKTNTVHNPTNPKHEPGTPSKPSKDVDVNLSDTKIYGDDGVLVEVGQILTYKIDFYNHNAEAADVTIKDTLDENVSYVADSASDNGTYDETTRTITWVLKDFPAETEGYVTFSVKVLASALTDTGNVDEETGLHTVYNKASVKIGNEDAQDTNTVENPVEPEEPEEPEEPHKSVDTNKDDIFVDDGVRVSVGDTLTYKIDYENPDDEEATVIITDKLDTGLDYVDNSASNGGIYNSSTRTITWTIENVEAHTNGSVTFTATVNDNATTLGYVDNTAVVKVGNHAEQTTNTVHNPVDETPDEETEEWTPVKDVDVDTTDTKIYGDDGVLVEVGQRLRYRVTYFNPEKEPADVTVTDALDKNVIYVDNSAIAYVYDSETEEYDITYAGTYTEDETGKTAGTLTWEIPSVPAKTLNYVEFDVIVLPKALTDTENVDEETGLHTVYNEASVQIGNDTKTTNKVKNPVEPFEPEEPVETPEVENPVPEKRVEIGNGLATGKDIDSLLSGNFDDNHKQAAVGSYVAYEITYKNTYDEAKTVYITDTLDKGLTFVQASDNGVYDDTTRTITWTVENVPANTAGSVKFVAIINENALDTYDVVNKASVKVGNGDEPFVDTNEVENPVPYKAIEIYDSTVDYADDKEGVHVGDTVTYKIDYKNGYESTARVIITDTLDKGLDFVSASNGGIYDADSRTITWVLRNVSAGTQGHVTFDAVVNETALIEHEVDNKAQVSVTPTPDKDKPNEPKQPVKDVDVNELYIYGDDGVLVSVGQTLTYKIDFYNHNTEAADVTITDTLDKNVRYIGGTASNGGTYDEETRTITWVLKDFPAETEGYVTFQVVVSESALDVLHVDNTAYVQIGNESFVQTNEVSNPVEPEDKEPGKPWHPSKDVDVNLSDTKIYGDNGVLVNVGQILTYKIDFYNHNAEAADVTITDTLDKNVSYVTDSASNNGAFVSDSTGETGGTITWTLEDFPAETAGYVTFSVEVSESALTDDTDIDTETGLHTVYNKASVQIGNDTAQETNEVENPVENPKTEPSKDVDVDLADTKIYGDDGVLVEVGQFLTYKIDFYNHLSDAADVTITDTLDENVRYIGGTASDGGTYDEETRTITWVLEGFPACTSGYVTFSVEVLATALTDNTDIDTETGLHTVYNEASVQIGNETAQKTNKVKNPVEEPFEPDEPIPTPEVENPVPEKKVETFDGDEEDGVLDFDDNMQGSAVEASVAYEIIFKNVYDEPKDITIVDWPVDIGLTFEGAYVSEEINNTLEWNAWYTETEDNTEPYYYTDDGGYNRYVTWTIKDFPADTVGSVYFSAVINENVTDSAYTDHPYEFVNEAYVKVGNEERFIKTNEVENWVTDKAEDIVTQAGENVDDGVYDDNKEEVDVGDEIAYEITYRNIYDTEEEVFIYDEIDPGLTLEENTIFSEHGNTHVNYHEAGNYLFYVDITKDGVTARYYIGFESGAPYYEDAETGNRTLFTYNETKKKYYHGDYYIGQTYFLSYDYEEDGVTYTGTLERDEDNRSFAYVGDDIYYIGYDGYFYYTDEEGSTVNFTNDTYNLTVAYDSIYFYTDEDDETTYIYLDSLEHPDHGEGNDHIYIFEAGEEIVFTREDEDGLEVTIETGITVSEETIVWDILDVEPDEIGIVGFSGIVNEYSLDEENANDNIYDTEHDGDHVSHEVDNQAYVQVGVDYSLGDNAFHMGVWTRVLQDPVPEKAVEVYDDEYDFADNMKLVAVGQDVTYEIWFRNSYDDEQTVTITDTLDKGLTFKSATINDSISGYPINNGLWSYKFTEDPTGETGGTIVWTLKEFPGQTEGTVFFTAEVNMNAVYERDEYHGDGTAYNFEVKNIAKVQIGNDTAIDTNLVENPVVIKSVETVDGVSGDFKDNNVETTVNSTITYRIDYKNAYDTEARVIITDVLDEALDFVSASNGGIYNPETRTLTWTITSVPAGVEGYVTFDAVINDKALTVHEVVNQAEVSVTPDEPEESDEPVKDVDVNTEDTKIYGDNGVRIEAGQTLTYRIDFRNYTNKKADVTVTDTLDKNVSYVDGSAISYVNGVQTENGTYDEATHTITWNISGVAAKRSGYVEFKVKVLNSVFDEENLDDYGNYAVENTGMVQIGNEAAQKTNKVYNPTDEEPEPEIPWNPTKDVDVDLSDEKIYGDNGIEVEVDQYVTYKIDFYNHKGTPAEITIVDVLDKNVAYIQGTASDGGVFTADSTGKTGGTITWVLEDFPAYTSGSVTFTVQVLEDALEAGEVDNGPVDVYIDNEHQTTNKVYNPVKERFKPDRPTPTPKVENPVPEKAVEVEDGMAGDFEDNLKRVYVGDELYYRITFRNTYDEPKDITITDTLDEGLDFVQASDGGTYDEETRTITWVLKDFPADTEGNVYFSGIANEYAMVNPEHPQEIHNIASVQVGTDPAMDTNEVENPVDEPPKSVDIDGNRDFEDNRKFTRVGDTLTYKVRYENSSELMADIVITDTLDIGLDFVQASDGGVYDESTRTITWTFKDVEPGYKGSVEFSAVANDNAYILGYIENTAIVKVGDNPEQITNTVHNPVDRYLYIEKLDKETGEPLEGAELTLKDAFGNVIESWTSATEKKVFKNLENGIYILSETAAPDGYRLADDITFTVKDGKVVESDDPTTVTMYDSKHTVIYIINREIPTEDILPGAVLQLVDEDGNVIREWTSGEESEPFYDLPNGHYTVVEITPPDGYIHKPVYEFDVTDESNGMTFVVYNKKYVTYFSKVDASSGNELSGAKLQILDSNGNVYDSWTSDGTMHEIKNMSDGTYTYKETAAPSGYSVASSIEFTLHDGNLADGTNIIVMKDNKRTSTPSGGSSSSTTRRMTFTKYNGSYIAGSTATISKDEKLAGVEFTIYYSDGSFYRTVVTGDDGTVSISVPAAGTYYFKETKAPEGYLIDETIYSFTVSSGGSVSGTTSITDYAKPEVRILKEDGDTGARLSGAVFDILNSNGDVVFTGTTDSEGAVYFTPDYAGTYTVVETAAPDGYDLNTTYITFTVSSTGSVSGTTTMKDYKNSTTTGSISANYDSRITGSGDYIIDENGNIIRGYYTIDENGNVIFVRTGDTFSYILIGMIWVLALAVIIYIVVKKRKTDKTDK